jgi:hypothetical protein
MTLHLVTILEYLTNIDLVELAGIIVGQGLFEQRSKTHPGLSRRGDKALDG